MKLTSCLFIAVLLIGSTTSQILGVLLQETQKLNQQISDQLHAQQQKFHEALGRGITPAYQYEWQNQYAHAQQYNYQYDTQGQQQTQPQTQTQTQQSQPPSQQQPQQQPQPQQLQRSQPQPQPQLQSQAQPSSVSTATTNSYDMVPRAKIPYPPIQYPVQTTPAPAPAPAPPIFTNSLGASTQGIAAAPVASVPTTAPIPARSAVVVAPQPIPAIAPSRAAAPANSPVSNTNTAAAFPTDPSNSHAQFSAKLYHVISASLPQRNIIYSPISLQTVLALIYSAANGPTAKQLQDALVLPKQEETPRFFHNLLRSIEFGGDAQPIMANKMYYNAQLNLASEMAEKARLYFDTDMEAIDFAAPNVVPKINNWVASTTHNRIQNLVYENQLNSNTQSMLISAIYFKAKWEKQFSVTNTEDKPFYVNARQDYLNVPMMYNDDVYRYGQFDQLDATALELPYENSKLSMLIILPNKVDGLYALEQRLQGTNLNALVAQMVPESVTVLLPRFRIEFELDMVEPLKRLGVKNLFTDRSDIRGFFPDQPVGVSKVQHKAYIDVNEAGSEAAGASFVKLIPLSLPNRIINFTANHPFMFAIRSPEAIFFIGHVVTF